ncbi:MAG: RDD family protein [Steroidobacteraceae bacterium]
MATPANKYAPPKSEVADVVPDDDIKASRGSRLGAAIIDNLILFIPMIPAYVLAMPLLVRAGAGAQRNAFAAWAVIASTGTWFYVGLLCAVIVLIINGIFAYQNGQSIAKKWLGIKDVRTDGSRVSFARIFWLRNVLNSAISLTPMIGSLYGLIDVLFIFGPAKRCVHDYIADTIVVRA